MGTSFVLVATFLYSVPSNKRSAIIEQTIAEEKALHHEHVEDEENNNKNVDIIEDKV